MTEGLSDTRHEIAEGTRPPAPHPVFGAPTKIVLQRSIEGEIDVSEFADLIAEIQHVIGDHGMTTVLGRSLTWQHVRSSSHGSSAGGPRLSVIIRADNGQTTIRIEEQISGLARGLFWGFAGGVGGWGLAMGVGGVALQGTYFLLGMGAATFGLSYLASRAIFYTIEKRKRHAHEELMDRLTQAIERSLHDER